MLRQLRSAEKIKKVLWVGLLLVIIPSFVAFYGWNTYSNTATGAPMAAQAEIDYGLFDDKEIGTLELRSAENSLKGKLSQYGRTFNVPVDQQAIERLAEPREILEEAINLEILRRYAEEHGIAVSTNEAVQAIRRMVPPEQQPMLQNYLRQSGISEQQYVEEQRQNLLLNKVQQTLGSNVRVTHYEAWLDYLLRNERLLVDFVRFDAADFATSVTVDDQELAKYFQENVAKYRVPDQVQYSYVLVKKDDLKTSVTVSEDEITSYYTNRQEEFRLSPTATVRQIMVKKPNMRELGTTATAEALTSATEEARAKAEDIYQRIAKGEDFAALADQLNEETRTVPREDANTTATDQQTTAGGFLGTVSQARMRAFYGDEWTSSVFALEPGSVGRPIEASRGFFIVKLENKSQGAMQDLEKVRPVVEERVRTQKVEPFFQQIGDQLNQAAGQYTGLKQLADVTSQTLRTSPKVAREADFIPGLGLLGDFAEAVRDLRKGGHSEVMSDATRHLIIEVTEEFPAHEPKLEEVRDAVVQGFREAKSREMAKKAADEVKAKAKDLATLEAAATDHNTTVTRTRPFTRTEAATVIGPVTDFLISSAGAKKGDVAVDTLGEEKNPSGYLVWLLSETTEPPKTDFARDLGKITQEIMQRKQEIATIEFFRDRRKALEGRIKIHEAYQ